MIGKKLLGQKPVSLPAVKRLVQERKKEGELSYEQNLALEYAKKFSKLTEKQAETMVSDLQGANEKLEEGNAVEIANLMPENIEELRLILAKERFILSDEELSKIMEVVEKHKK
jgi:DNA-directed RNA polymerase subunit F